MKVYFLQIYSDNAKLILFPHSAGTARKEFSKDEAISLIIDF